MTQLRRIRVTVHPFGADDAPRPQAQGVTVEVQRSLENDRGGETSGIAADERQSSERHPGGSDSRGRVLDDRRRPVKPTDNPVPSSPDPEGDAVREGEEKLARIKAY